MTGTQECDPCRHLRTQLEKTLREALEAVLRIQCIEEHPAIYSKARQALAATEKDGE